MKVKILKWEFQIWEGLRVNPSVTNQVQACNRKGAFKAPKSNYWEEEESPPLAGILLIY